MIATRKVSSATVEVGLGHENRLLRTRANGKHKALVEAELCGVNGILRGLLLDTCAVSHSCTEAYSIVGVHGHEHDGPSERSNVPHRVSFSKPPEPVAPGQAA